jgi:hypothetical protein
VSVQLCGGLHGFMAVRVRQTERKLSLRPSCSTHRRGCSPPGVDGRGSSDAALPSAVGSHMMDGRGTSLPLGDCKGDH